ncbi:MAG: CocE/NonD family hydrolase, partial [Terriglobus sp.]
TDREVSTSNRMNPLLRILLVTFVLFIAYAIALWPYMLAHLQAVAVMKQVAGQPIPRFLRNRATEAVSQRDLTIPTPDGPIHARLYLPAQHPNAPGLVVFHGVHHLGMDEPRLEAFAQAMAASGLNVLTPELPDIKDYRVSEASIRGIGESTKWFAQQRGAPVGVMGLSFSGGLSLVAAANPAYAPSMKFVFAVGSQGAMTRVAAYYRTGSDPRPDGTIEVLPAHEYGPLVLEYEHINEFVPTKDVTPIRNVLRAHLYEDKSAEENAIKHLNATQVAEAKHLMDAASDSTHALLLASEQKHAVEMQQLSPDAHLHDLTVPVFLLHGEADNIIPAAETLWMASQLRAEYLHASLVSPMLSHLDMNKEPSLGDQWRLIHFMAKVLRMAHQS